MSKLRCILIIILSIFIASAGIYTLVHDADYIFTGNTLNLNEILENGEEPPRGEYVTYICYVPLGNYAETRQYINGIIPLPGTTQQYAFLTENDTIMSAEIESKSKIEEMERLTDALYNDEDTAAVVELVGHLGMNGAEMDGYLQEYFEGADLEENGILVSPYMIDTTVTRLSLGASLTFMLALSVGMAVISIRDLKKLKIE